MNPLPSAEIEIRVPFHDVDALRVVWHGHYVKYLELARCQLLDSFDYGYNAMAESGYAWPVIDLHLRYVKALRFDQRILVRATLKEWEYRMKIAYLISDAQTGERLCKAESIQVAVTLTGLEMQLMSPPVLAQKLGITA